jgi:hypothetical protein
MNTRERQTVDEHVIPPRLAGPNALYDKRAPTLNQQSIPTSKDTQRIVKAAN